MSSPQITRMFGFEPGIFASSQACLAADDIDDLPTQSYGCRHIEGMKIAAHAIGDRVAPQVSIVVVIDWWTSLHVCEVARQFRNVPDWEWAQALTSRYAHLRRRCAGRGP